jgi:fatty acid desaturase
MTHQSHDSSLASGSDPRLAPEASYPSERTAESAEPSVTLSTPVPAPRHLIPGERSRQGVPGSSFTALTRQVQELGLMRRRYGYYWAKLIGTVLVLAAWVLGFVWIGDSWWQLAMAAALAILMTQAAFLGHDAAHRQIFRSGRWNDWVSLIVANLLVGISYAWWQGKHTRHHAAPNHEGVDPDIALRAIAMTPSMARRHRTKFMRWLVDHQGWYFFPLLFLQGISMHVDGIRRVMSRDRVRRRWVEAGFLALRLGGLLALVLVVLSPGKAAAFLGVELAIFGFYLGFSFAPNHIGMPLVPASLKLDFLRRQVLMSRNIAGGPVMSVFMGGLNFQIEHHLFPSIARPHLRKLQPLVAAHCASEGVPYAQVGIRAAFKDVIRYLNTVGLRGNDPYVCPMVAYRLAPGGAA